MPRDPSARHGSSPIQGFVMEGVAVETQIEMLCIAVDHRQIVFLTTFVEAEPQAETIRQRHLFLDRFRGLMAVDCSFSIIWRGRR